MNSNDEQEDVFGMLFVTNSQFLMIESMIGRVPVLDHRGVVYRELNVMCFF